MSKVTTVREDTGRRRVQTMNTEPSMTVQSDRDRSEIREILRRYRATGVADSLNRAQLTFRDVTAFEDFSDLMRQNVVAQGEFMKLPSKVREVFGHDVANWLDAANDGLDEVQTARLVKLGVLDAPEPPVAPGPPSSVETPDAQDSR